MLKRNIFLPIVLGISALCFSQEEQPQLPDTIELSPIMVTAQMPITTEVITEQQIESKNLGQDMPILLKNSVGVVTTSDAGGGIGYTSMRIRGAGQGQVNVTFNGVPVNDSESHGVFWVDFPDLSSSTGKVLIQRGVGTSSNGAAAFGASVNLETENDRKKSFAELQAVAGSFNTQKYMIHAGSGDFAEGKLNVDGRLSYVKSDGYIDRASSDLLSFAVNAYYKPNENTEFQVMNLFGHEKTYQAWYGIDSATVVRDRTFNPAGAIYDADYNVVDFYDNQVDNYDQNHLHLYWRQKWSDNWRSTATLHYTRGLGYYEEYKQGADLASYHINNGMESADLVRRQWLNNHFYGAIFNLEAKNLNMWDLYFGLAANNYIGGHYGKVVDVVDVNYMPFGKYYENESTKTEFSGYVKALKKLGRVELFGDVQLRYIDYEAAYKNNGENPIKDFFPYAHTYNFVNPKAGINYVVNNGKVYFSYGLTHREPTRSDILDSGDTVKEETLQDFELGYRHNGALNFGINAYYMNYKNQLVLTGQIDDVGSPIRENVGKSYRAGVELDASYDLIADKLNAFGNFAYSQNKNRDYFIKDSEGNAVSLGDTDISFSPKIVSSFGLEYLPTKNLKFNLTNKYVSEQYVTNAEISNGVLDAYFISDLLAKYNWNFSGNNRMEISLLVNNLFDVEYQNNGYYYEGLYAFPQAGRNILGGVKLFF